MPKYVVDFDNDFDRMLKTASQTNQTPAENKSDVIRRAVALYTFLHKQLEMAEGAKVAIVTLDPNDSSKVTDLITVIDKLP
jgi:hypothetical protein